MPGDSAFAKQAIFDACEESGLSFAIVPAQQKNFGSLFEALPGEAWKPYRERERNEAPLCKGHLNPENTTGSSQPRCVPTKIESNSDFSGLSTYSRPSDRRRVSLFEYAPRFPWPSTSDADPHRPSALVGFGGGQFHSESFEVPTQNGLNLLRKVGASQPAQCHRASKSAKAIGLSPRGCAVSQARSDRGPGGAPFPVRGWGSRRTTPPRSFS